MNHKDIGLTSCISKWNVCAADVFVAIMRPIGSSFFATHFRAECECSDCLCRNQALRQEFLPDDVRDVWDSRIILPIIGNMSFRIKLLGTPKWIASLINFDKRGRAR